MPPSVFHLNRTLYKDLRDYIPALEEACRDGRVDPVEFLINTEDYPRVAKKIGAGYAEFVVGYIHALVAFSGVALRPLWKALQAEFGEPPGKLKAGPKRKAALPKGRPVLALPAPLPPEEVIEDAEIVDQLPAARAKRRRKVNANQTGLPLG